MARHEFELGQSEAATKTIVSKLLEDPRAQATVERLLKGHVTEEQDLPIITHGLGFRLQVACPDDLQRPFLEFNERETATLKFVLSSRRHDEVCHWEPIVLVLHGFMRLICRDPAGLPSTEGPPANPPNL